MTVIGTTAVAYISDVVEHATRLDEHLKELRFNAVRADLSNMLATARAIKADARRLGQAAEMIVYVLEHPDDKEGD